jgi:toxin HigB-1
MWQVFEHRRLGKQLESVPEEILKRYEKWKDIVVISGPEGLRQIKGFHDEALRGEWKGYRSSRLGIKYRVLFKVEADKNAVYVFDVIPHEYRKK